MSVDRWRLGQMGEMGIVRDGEGAWVSYEDYHILREDWEYMEQFIRDQGAMATFIRYCAELEAR